MRSVWSRIGSLVVVVAIAAGAAACASDVDAQGPIAASPSPTATPTPTPTADPVVTVPVAAFGGDCAASIDAEIVAEILGDDAAVTAGSGQWSPAIATAGGIDCGWQGDAGYFSVLAFPAASVPPDVQARYAQTGCQLDYGAIECLVTRLGGNTWIVATQALDYSETLPSPSAALLRIADSAAEASTRFPQPEAVTASERTWSIPLDCAAMAESIDVPSLLGGGTIDDYWFGDNLFADGGTPLEELLVFDLAVAGRCAWMEKDTRDELEVAVMPDAAWSLDAVVADHDEAVPVSVAGAEAAYELDVYGTGILASDGVNLVWVKRLMWASREPATPEMAAAVLAMNGG